MLCLVQTSRPKRACLLRAHSLDTTDTVVFGEGSVDLAQGSAGGEAQQPKDMSLGDAAYPAEYHGHAEAPEGQAGNGPARVAHCRCALFAVAPPAALLPLIETGPGKDTDCGASTRMLRQSTRRRTPRTRRRLPIRKAAAKEQKAAAPTERQADLKDQEGARRRRCQAEGRSENSENTCYRSES